jgi:hypothetical protein
LLLLLQHGVHLLAEQRTLLLLSCIEKMFKSLTIYDKKKPTLTQGRKIVVETSKCIALGCS